MEDLSQAENGTGFLVDKRESTETVKYYPYGKGGEGAIEPSLPAISEKRQGKIKKFFTHRYNLSMEKR